MKMSRSLHAAVLRFLGHGVDNSWKGSMSPETSDRVERQWHRTKARFYDRLAKMEQDNADLLAQNQRLQDHVDTHHRYFEEIHAKATKDYEMKKGCGEDHEFSYEVMMLTHPNAGERG